MGGGRPVSLLSARRWPLGPTLNSLKGSLPLALGCFPDVVWVDGRGRSAVCRALAGNMPEPIAAEAAYFASHWTGGWGTSCSILRGPTSSPSVLEGSFVAGIPSSAKRTCLTAGRVPVPNKARLFYTAVFTYFKAL